MAMTSIPLFDRVHVIYRIGSFNGARKKFNGYDLLSRRYNFMRLFRFTIFLG